MQPSFFCEHEHGKRRKTGSQASLTPSLPAAQPATFVVEGRTVRPLGDENDKAFALVNALDATQRSQAILNYRVADLVLGPGQDGRTIQPESRKWRRSSPRIVGTAKDRKS